MTPVGIKIDRNWIVGKKLGSGACAAVHALTSSSGEPTEYAIKLAPLPTKVTRKKNSPAEINAARLYYEHVVYQNQFVKLQGKLIPKLPLGSKKPSSHGDRQGYRFLVMERMEKPLWDCIPDIVDSCSTSIPLGPLAVQLLTCVEAIHECRHIVIDIKPENFMFANNENNSNSNSNDNSRKRKSKKEKSIVEEYAANLRLLDLALVQRWDGIGGHRENEGSSGMVGTPLYASLNIHDGETPSRRDDLEALGYLIAELIMKITSSSSNNKNVGSNASQLPWSHGKSDCEIGKIKSKQVEDLKSNFYKQMGNNAVVNVMRKYLDEVQSYTYKKDPDYDRLKSILSDLDIPIKKSSAKPAKKTSATKGTTPTTTVASHETRTTRSSRFSSRLKTKNTSGTNVDGDDGDDDSDDCKESPTKIRRSCSSRKTNDDSFEELENAQMESYHFVMIDDSDDDNDDEVEEMDWELTPDENRTNKATKTKPTFGVTLLIEEGPHKGESFTLIKGQNERVVIGRRPKVDTSSTDEQIYALPKDKHIDDVHVTLELCGSKRAISVRVTDMKTTTGTFVGQEQIPKGKDHQIFINHTFGIGISTIKVKKWVAPALPSTTAATISKAAPVDRSTASNKLRGRSSTSKSVTEVLQPVSANDEQSGVKKVGIRVVVTEGPHKGESFALEKGGLESVTIGSKVSASKELSLSKDSSVGPKHVRLELARSKNLLTVRVFDLKSNEGTIINGRRVPYGKEDRAFYNDRIRLGDTLLELKKIA